MNSFRHKFHGIIGLSRVGRISQRRGLNRIMFEKEEVHTTLANELVVPLKADDFRAKHINKVHIDFWPETESSAFYFTGIYEYIIIICRY